MNVKIPGSGDGVSEEVLQREAPEVSEADLRQVYQEAPEPPAPPDEEAEIRRLYREAPTPPEALAETQRDEIKGAQRDRFFRVLFENRARSAKPPSGEALQQIEALRISQDTKLDPKFVRDNLDSLYPSWAAAQQDPQKWQQMNPELSEFILRHPSYFDLATEDKQLGRVLTGLRNLKDFAVGGATSIALRAPGTIAEGAGLLAQVLEDMAPVAGRERGLNRNVSADFQGLGHTVNKALGGAADTVDEALISNDTRLSFQNSQFDGEVFEPSTWTFGKDPSLKGVSFMMVNVLGQMAPILVANAATGGVGAMVVAGMQSAGGASESARAVIDEWAADNTLASKSAYYRDLLADGRSEAEALELTKEAAAKLAGIAAAPIGAAGGQFISVVMDPAAKAFAGSAGRQLAGRVLASLIEEPVQEVAESYAGQVGRNVAAGAPVGTELGKGTLADAAMGLLFGGTLGVAGSRRAIVGSVRSALSSRHVEGVLDLLGSTTAQANAQAVADLVEEHGGASTYYAQADVVQRHLEDQGKTAEEVFGPEITRQIADAARDGDRVALPLELILKQEDTLARPILEDSATDPDLPTHREEQAHQAEVEAETLRLQQLDATVPTEGEEGASKISEYEQRLTGEMEKALQERGFSRSDAKHQAMVWRAEIRTHAAREGKDPAELFRFLEVQIKNDGTVETSLADAAQRDAVVRGTTTGTDLPGGGRRFTLTLTPDANHSTFLHESAHIFLERAAHLLEQRGADASEGLRKGFESLAKWAGYGSLEQMRAMQAEAAALQAKKRGGEKKATRITRWGPAAADHTHVPPHGIYFTLGGDSPHTEYGDTLHEFEANAKNPLVLKPGGRIEHARFRRYGVSAGEPAAGVAALRALSTPEEFAAFLKMSKAEALEALRAEFPAVDPGERADAYEVLEIVGAERARAAGHDALVAEDQILPEFSEFVALDSGAIRKPNSGPPPIPTKEARRAKALKGHETRIKDLPQEHAVAVDQEGKVFFEATSAKTAAVDFEPADMIRMAEHGSVTLTHNHPLGGTFSGADIAFAVAVNLAEIRAVDKHTGTVWILRRPEAGWKQQVGLEKWHGLDKAARRAVIEKRRAVSLHWAEVEAEALRRSEGINQDLLKRFRESTDAEEKKQLRAEAWRNRDEHLLQAYQEAAEALGDGWTIERRDPGTGGDEPGRPGAGGVGGALEARLRELNAPHEKFARAFEAYAMEGKAPSRELRPAFARYRVWLTEIYGEVGNLGVELNPEIRAVMDRMLATEKEIADAMRSSGDWFAFFKTPEQMGVTPAEFERLKDLQVRATSKAALRANRKMIQDRLRANEERWKQLLNEKVAKFREAYKKLPAYRARRFLQGFIINPETGTEGSMGRVYLDRKITEEMVGAKATNFPLKKNGVNPDGIADLFGYESGKAMLEAMLPEALPDEKTWAKAQAEKEMVAEHPGLLEDRARLEQEIQDSLHNKDMAKFLLAQLNTLHRLEPNPAGKPLRVRRPGLYLRAVQRAAEARVRGEKIHGLNPEHARRAEENAGEMALKAMLEGNPAQATAFKEKQLVQHARYVALVAARKAKERFLRTARLLSRDSVRAEIGKGSDENVLIRRGIDTLLAKLELRKADADEAPITTEELHQIGTLVEAAGGTLAGVNLLTEILHDKHTRKTLTVEQMEVVHGALKTIRAAAVLNHRTLVGGEWMDTEEVERAFLAEISQRGDARSVDDSNTFVAKLKEIARGGANELERIETIVQVMGGVNRVGSWAFRTLIEPMMQGHYREAALLEKHAKPVFDAYMKMPKSVRRKGMRRIDGSTFFPDHIKGFDPPKTVQQLIMLTLNAGNLGNLSRLDTGRGILKEQILHALEATFDAKEGRALMKWVQSVWDAAEAMWPEARAIQERQTGLAPEKVSAEPLEVFGKIHRGGYFPLRYDYRSEIQSDNGSVANFLSREFIPPGTPHGHLENRAVKHDAVIDLRVDGIYRGLRHVAHDIAYRETIQSVARFLLRPNVQQGIQQHYGAKAHAELLQWVKDVGRMQVLGEGNHAETFNRLARSVRTMSIQSILGWRLPTAAADAPNVLLPVVAGQITMRGLAEGFRIAASDQARVRDLFGKLGAWQEILGGTMEAYQREASRLGRGFLTAGGPVADFRDFSFSVYEHISAGLAAPVALAAYEQVLNQGRGEAEAIAYANHVLRETFASKSIINAAPILRDRGFFGTSLSFFGFTNGVAYQRMRLIFEPLLREKTWTGKAQTLPRLAGQLLGWVIAYQHFAEILMGRGPEDEEDWATWFARKGLMAAPSTIPLLGDLAAWGIEGQLFGRKTFSPRGSPLADAQARLTRAISKAKNADELSDAFFAYYEIVGYLTGTPVYPVSTMGKHVVDVAKGAEPSASKLFFGR